MNPYSFRKTRNQLYTGNSSARISPTINRVKPFPDSALRSAIFLKCLFSRIAAASTLPCLRLCQLLFCTIVSEFYCLEANHWMTHPFRPTCYQPYGCSDYSPYSEKTKTIHSKTRDHLPQGQIDQAWAAVVVMEP